MKKRLLFIALGGLVAFAGVSQQTMRPDMKLRYAEQVIEKFYVDTVDMNEIAEAGIVAMLKQLDPHSQYSNPEETRELTEPLEGNFSGIGIQFNMSTDSVYVIQTIAGGPSEKVGILAGDRIIAADDSVISGVKMKNAQVIKKLRGPKGSKVRLTVVRKGVPEPIEFVVVRDDIPIYSVDAAYMTAPTVGYIRINRFAESTAREVAQAISKLKKKGMKHLMIDLSGNSGGYLNAAIDVADMLLDKGDKIVFTRGSRVPDMDFVAENKPMLPKSSRVVVLVNQYSASASEILAGALQDNDRGVIVGRRTFGKGLVQRPVPFPDGSMVRITTSRYYTPSGRCIQKPYENGDDPNYDEDILHRYKAGELSSADSVHFDAAEKYTTRSGRTVYGGGGIMPDVFVPIDTAFYSDYYRDLIAKGSFNRFCVNYVDENREELKSKYRTEDEFVAGFTVTDEMMEVLKSYGEADGVVFNEEQFAVSRPQLEANVKGLIGRDMFDQSTILKVLNELDSTYKEGVSIILDEDAYNKLLKP